SCAAAELEELPAKADGEAPAPATSDQAMPAQSPAAEDARTALVTDLRARADAMFEDDRRLVLSPMLKAAGVRVRRIPVSAVSVAR
ncbi:MAG TPA: hypothetical protein VHX64_16500, partial [Caulobacteraceae bacterium]|nr:hypothetical protein [Caulobacteraceae bacterium]